MICTFHNVLGPLDNKVDEAKTFNSIMFKKMRVKYRFLNICLPQILSYSSHLC